MRLSVVIPTHNRAELLALTLAALEQQTLPPDDFEVLVVDDGSRDEVRAQLRGLRRQLSHYRLLEKPQGGLASARNHGAAAATGAVLLFLDDDVVPAPATLAEHLASHAAATAAVVVLGSLPYPPGWRVDNFLWYLEATSHFDLYKDPRKYAGGRPPMPPLNGNSSLPRALFAQLGGYDESFSSYGGEDLDLGYRLAQAGVAFVYNPRAVGYHHHSKGFAQFCIDMERSGEAVARLGRRYPEVRAGKKVDIVADPFRTLPPRKRLWKLIMLVSLACPWLQAPARALLALCRRLAFMRPVAFPLYRWIGHTHYARGIRRVLREEGARPAGL